MTEKELMLSGQLYFSGDKELSEERKRTKKLTRLYNNTTEEELEYRTELLSELFGSLGKNAWIEPDFHCDYGYNISIGNNFYANYGCIILDVCSVNIGDNVFFAPRVSLFTATHPIDAEVRNSGLEYGKPITIGNSVWIGGGTVINPGVSIGDGTVIGSGSVVTKDMPSNVIAAGNPCRVIREIIDKDKQYWQRQAELYKTAMYTKAPSE
ncbi:MAG: sugar O-acetyltransferase [Clostridia bacterium]|nr:sugar O-acetyltransferase [Clostridia bacterium]